MGVSKDGYDLVEVPVRDPGLLARPTLGKREGMMPLHAGMNPARQPLRGVYGPGIPENGARDDTQDNGPLKRLKPQSYMLPTPHSNPRVMAPAVMGGGPVLSKARRARKPKGPRGKAFPSLVFENEQQLFHKLEGIASQVGHKHKQRVGGDWASESQSLYKGVGSRSDRQYLRWVIDEYFYSDVDKGYFSNNLLQQFTRKLEIPIDDKGLPVAEWNVVRKMIGKPRRFSQALVMQEIDTLHTYRDKARTWLTKKQLVSDGRFSKELSNGLMSLQPLQVVGRD